MNLFFYVCKVELVSFVIQKLFAKNSYNLEKDSFFFTTDFCYFESSKLPEVFDFPFLSETEQNGLYNIM